MNNSLSGNSGSWSKVDALEVGIFPDQAALAAFAAESATNYLRQVVGQNGSATVIFATGNSQLEFLNALAGEARIDWGAITVFHMDEYLGITRDHGASFQRFIREKVEKALIPGRIHYLDGCAVEPMKECDRYTALLQAQPVDLCCLGIGENGHIAFNDPDVADFDDSYWVKIVRLDHACRKQQVGEGHFPNLESVPSYALTLTIPMLCSAARMLCISPELRKAAAVRDALTGPITTACPASILRRQPQATLLLDEASASAWRGD